MMTGTEEQIVYISVPWVECSHLVRDKHVFYALTCLIFPEQNHQCEFLYQLAYFEFNILLFIALIIVGIIIKF